MKNLILLIILSYSGFLFAQVGIGTITPHPSSILEVNSTTKGFLPPVMTNTEIVDINNPAKGLLAYSTDEKCLTHFDGSKWINVCTQTDIIVQTDFSVSPLRIKADNIDAGDNLGFRMAISGDGNTVAATASREDSDAQGVDNNNASNSGAVYVYSKIGGVWSAPIRLKADNIGANDQFGGSVDLSEDGNVLVVGARDEDSDAQGVDNNDLSNSGAVYVFRRVGGVWGSPTRLKADNLDIDDGFGIFASLSGDGNTLVVGANEEDSDAQGVDNNNASNSGAVYVFRYTGGSWSSPIRLKSDNVETEDRFGGRCALSFDGNVLAVSASQEDSDAQGVDNNNLSASGAVYIFRFTGGSWSSPTRLKSNNIGLGDQFGLSLDLAGDGNTLIVGAYEDSDAQGVDNDNANNAGAVYIIRYTGGSWNIQTRLKADNIGADDLFGFFVAISKNGNTVAVSAVNEDSDAQGVDNNNLSSSGAVYVYGFSGGTWSIINRLKADNPGNGDWLGWGIGLSGDGNTLVAGAINEDSDAQGVDNDNASNSGAVYIFE